MQKVRQKNSNVQYLRGLHQATPFQIVELFARYLGAVKLINECSAFYTNEPRFASSIELRIVQLNVRIRSPRELFSSFMSENTSAVMERLVVHA